MRNLKLVILAMVFTTAVLADVSRQKAQGFCEQGGKTVTVNATVTSTGLVQHSYKGCTVNVYLTGTTTPATIYSDNIGTPLANPFTADATTGLWAFYADDGTYDVRNSGGTGSLPAYTRGGYSLFDRQFNGTSGATAYPIKTKLLDWVSARDYGAVCDGTTDDHVAIQAAITYIQSVGGGTIIFPVGTCSIGTVGIHILPNSSTSSGVRLLGTGKYSTLLKYTGTTNAVAIGTSGSYTYRNSMEDIGVTITTAGASAVGVNIFTCLHCEFTNSGVFTAFDRASSLQTGLRLSGGAQGVSFGAYFQWKASEVRGGFKYGVYMDGELGWGFNACQFLGGTISSQGSPVAGTIGLWVHQGNQNVFQNIDVENFATGYRSDAYANAFVASRTEGNSLGVNLTVRSGDCCAVPTSTTGGEFNMFYAGNHSDGFTDSSGGSAQIWATLAGSNVESHINGFAYLDSDLQIRANHSIAWQGVGGGSSGLFWLNGTGDNVNALFSAAGILKLQLNGVDYMNFNPNESPVRGVEFMKGIYRNGAGFQHVTIPAASFCSTSNTIGASCAFTITWNTAFVDTNYTPVCSIGVVAAGQPVLNLETKSTTTITGRIIATTAAVANGGINCIAVHY